MLDAVLNKHSSRNKAAAIATWNDAINVEKLVVQIKNQVLSHARRKGAYRSLGVSSKSKT